VSCPERDRRLVASIAQVGQMVPVVVVEADVPDGPPVLIDGYRRIRALKHLKHEVVLAMRWGMPEMEALLLRRALSSTGGESCLEQAWLLRALKERFGLTFEELARRFDRTVSWVSRRLALLTELPGAVQEHIRAGRIAPHAAAKHLVPLARANRDHCTRLSDSIARLRLSSREVGAIHEAWRGASPAVRERLVRDPGLFLRSRRALAEEPAAGFGPRTGLLEDLATVVAVLRRAGRRLTAGAATVLTPEERNEVRCALSAARIGMESLARNVEKAIGGTDARRGNEGGGACVEGEGAERPPDREDAPDLAGCGAEGRRFGDDRGAEARAGGEGGTLP
jgi:ParB/RepB/Spo0J family partition protein